MYNYVYKPLGRFPILPNSIPVLRLHTMKIGIERNSLEFHTRDKTYDSFRLELDNERVSKNINQHTKGF